MTTAKKKLLTANDLLALHSKGVKGELIRGVLCETVSTSGKHGEIVSNFIIGLGVFVKPRKLGRIFGSDAGVRLERNPDTVREPDVGFISAERLPLDVEANSYYEVAPELVVEIASPNDTRREVNDKALMWLHYGVALVWVAYPDTRTIDVHQTGATAVTLAEGDTLDGGTVLPGFTLPVREVFE
jgi:Uma2 family endonuclease